MIGRHGGGAIPFENVQISDGTGAALFPHPHSQDHGR